MKVLYANIILKKGVQPQFDYENVYAHKNYVIKYNGVVYHYYCAVNDKGERTIALAISHK